MGTKKAFSFAHLLSRAGIRADGDQDGNDQDQNDERKQGDDESDEDYAKRMEELDKDDQGDGKKDAKADGDDADADADDSGESDKEKAARAGERARCAAIFGSKAAAARPDVAAHLAFNTSMGAASAIGMLSAFAANPAPTAASASHSSLASRMQAVPDQNVGASGSAPPARSPQGAAAAILAAGKKRRGES